MISRNARLEAAGVRREWPLGADDGRPERIRTMQSTIPARVKTASTRQLLELWDLTESMKRSPELPVVRGWLMDELETRDPAGFNAWMESDDPNAGPKDFIKH